ncbi:hypothetical protein GCM10011409_19130 [Lentibacillus populi]|uniref:Phage tail family protein n=1 Tax=Lentibacillus populi TaxID=1827502 RepID=A0A9W5TWY6_9BACI|nr:phage tail family protein [Lentibacillus populi]GGB41761.1 hypothetical protein GCM10011409_19130 [Lentibacillus populi]
MEISFTNARGQEAVITSRAPFLLESFDGYGDVGADTQTQNSPYQDGAMYIDSILEERPINMTFVILADDSRELMAKKRFISSVFNPKFGLGLLKHERVGIIHEISPVAESVPQFPSGSQNRGPTYQRVTVDLIAPNPYWRDPNQTSKPLQAYVGNFTLPFTLPFELGMSGSRTLLYNVGDVPAPVRIDIQGPVTNPQIINRTTSEWLRVNRSVAAGEILHIDTTEGQKRAEIYRGNQVYSVFGDLDHDSDWIQLALGENEIEHIADAGDRTSLVAVTWNSMYVGI